MGWFERLLELTSPALNTKSNPHWHGTRYSILDTVPIICNSVLKYLALEYKVHWVSVAMILSSLLLMGTPIQGMCEGGWDAKNACLKWKVHYYNRRKYCTGISSIYGILVGWQAYLIHPKRCIFSALNRTDGLKWGYQLYCDMYLIDCLSNIEEVDEGASVCRAVHCGASGYCQRGLMWLHVN